MNLFEFAELLMTTDKKQCFYEMVINDKYCALGVLNSALSLSLKDLELTKQFIWVCLDFRLLTGFSISYTNDIKRWSFPRIGEYLLCSLLPG